MSSSRLAAQIVVRVALTTFLLAGAHSPLAADPLSEGRFRDEVVGVVRALRPEAEVVLAPDPAQIRIGPRTIDLTNLYADVRDLPASEKRSRIGAFFTGLLADRPDQGCCTPLTYPDARRRLRVQLVPHEIIADHPELVRRPFSETLNVVYVLDEPQRYRYVTRDMLEAWGVDRTQIESVAVANLAEASADIPAELALSAKGQPAYLLSQGGDDYDAARLLVPRFLDGLRSALKTDAIILAAPTRNLLMAWPQNNPDRAAYAAMATKLMRSGPYGRSDELFHFDADGLRPLSPAERAGHRR